MLAVVRVLAAVCLLVLGVACAPPLPTSLLSQPYSSHGPVDDMLDHRSKAFRDGDERAFLADLDPTQTAMVDHERMVFANLRQLTFTEFRYHRFYPPAIRKQLKLEEGKPLSEVVQLAYQIAGVDAGHSEDSFDYTIVPRHGKPVITRIEPSTLGAGLMGIPWNDVPLHVARDGNVVVAADATIGELAPMAARLSAADAQVRKVWGSRPAAPGTLVFATTDRKRADRWLPTTSLTKVETAALTVRVPGTTRDDEVTDTFVGGRVVLTVGQTPENQLDITYRHELTHAITAVVTHLDTPPPTWAVEGFAVWVEDPVSALRFTVVRSAVKAGRFSGRLPDQASFYDSPSLNYALGVTIFQFVAQRFGPEAAADFYSPLVGGRPLGEVTRKLWQLDETAFTQQWADFVRQRAAQ